MSEDSDSMLCDGINLIKRSELQTTTTLFCPRHLDVQGNKRSDELPGSAVIGDQMKLNPPLVRATVKKKTSILNVQIVPLTLLKR